MQDSEKVQKTTISGYQHPESVNTSRDNRYKTFNDSDRKKKSIDEYSSTSVGAKFKKFSDYADIKPMTLEEIMKERREVEKKELIENSNREFEGGVSK